MNMSDTELKALLAAEKADALAADSASRLSSDRERAQDYYNGDVSRDVPTVAGRSSAVSTDVSDTIEGMMPQLMEVFFGGDDVVQFTPVGPEDVEAALQETDYVNHVFQKSNGFMVLYQFIKDALLSKNGIVKVWTEEEETETRETYYDQPADALPLLLNKPGIEVTEYTEHDGLHDLTVVCKKKYKHHKVEGVPPEEYGISRRAKSTWDATYQFHESTTTVGQLIEQGYDEDQIKSLPSVEANRTSEATTRDTVDEGASAGDEGLNSYGRPVLRTEHYIRMNYEDKPGLYRVVTGGVQGDVLMRDGKRDVSEVEYAPFAAMTPVIVTHRFFGKSIADLVMDIQRIKTVLTRGMLDNLYLHNNPRVEVAQSHITDQTMDDLLVSRPGGIVRTKAPGGVQWQVVPDITQSIYPALEYFDATREWRTGVTRQAQGIDASALENQTATATNQVFTAAQARIRLIARIFAETGISDLFTILHAEIRKHGDQQQTVRLRNKWVAVDPRNWKTRDDMTVDVGLGTGGKQQQLGNMTAIANIQKELVLGGKTNIVSDKNLYNTMKDIAKIVGKVDTESYFTDPATVPPPPPPVDPKMAELEMKSQLDKQAMNHKAQIETIQANADIATNERKLTAEIARDERKFQLEKELALFEAGLKQQEHQADLAHMGKKAEIDEHVMLRKADTDERIQTRKVDQEAEVKGSVSKTLKALSDKIDETQKMAKAPRKTKVIRDPKTNRVVEAISEVIN